MAPDFVGDLLRSCRRVADLVEDFQGDLQTLYEKSGRPRSGPAYAAYKREMECLILAFCEGRGLEYGPFRHMAEEWSRARVDAHAPRVG